MPQLRSLGAWFERRIHAIPLARRLVLLTAIFLATVYAGDGAIVIHHYQGLVAHERETRDAKAQLLAEHAGRALSAIDLSLEIIAERLKRRLPLDKPTVFTQLLLDKYLRKLPEVRALSVADAKGQIVNDTQSFPPPHFNIADRAHFAEQKKWRGVGLFFGKIEISRVDGKAFFPMSYPILDDYGNFEGVVTAVAEPAYFSGFYAPDGGEQNAFTLLERDDGAILAGTGLSDRELTDGRPKLPPYRDKGDTSVAAVRGFPAKIVVIGRPTATTPEFLTFVAMDAGLLVVMTIVAWLLATAAAREAAAVAREAEARQTAEARLLGAIESAPAAFALFDKDDRLILSNALYASFFAPIKDLIVPGKTFAELAEAALARGAYGHLHADDDTFLQWRLEQHRAGIGEPIIQLRDGHWVLMRERRTKQGDIVLFCSDITRLKEREAELRQSEYAEKLAREQAEQANRAKTDFLASMSHELRTPLNAIIGFSEMIERAVKGPVPETYREYGQLVRTSGEHLLSIINDILDIAKLNAGKTELQLEPVDAARIIGEAVAIVSERAAGARVKVTTASGTACPEIEADPLRLRQVMLNLITNAVKFTPAGGEVEVSTAVVGDELRIAVRDTGMGMAPEDIPQALAPFAQVGAHHTRHHEGTGLGLPISKSLVELHGGRFEIASALGLGTTVTISLPIRRPGKAASGGILSDAAVGAPSRM